MRPNLGAKELVTQLLLCPQLRPELKRSTSHLQSRLDKTRWAWDLGPGCPIPFCGDEVLLGNLSGRMCPGRGPLITVMQWIAQMKPGAAPPCPVALHMIVHRL